jgi:hypothetical protein
VEAGDVSSAKSDAFSRVAIGSTTESEDISSERTAKYSYVTSLVQTVAQSECLLLCSQGPSTGPCPQPDQSSACNSICITFILILSSHSCRGIAVGIATGYGLEDRGSELESRWGNEFSLLRIGQTGSGVHPSYHPMGNAGPFLGGKAAGQ